MKFPVFPLNGAILFPGTNLPLNIFEERYIQMIDYALSNNRILGMIQKKQNGDFFNVGCLGKITNFTETDDGKYQINLLGLDRFYFNKKIKNSNKFITIDGDILETKKTIKSKSDINTKLLFNFNKFLDVQKINFNTSEFEGLDSLSLAKIICVISPLDYLIKQMLLEFNSAEELCSNLLSVLEIEMQKTEKSIKIN
jgi:uncharacterized protein